MATRSVSGGSYEIHLFLLWSEALDREQEILADIGRRFEILEAVRIEWTRARFSRNLTRLYGQALPPGSEKELHCGTGPFLVVVVSDRKPRYGRRSVSGREQVVNISMYEAKQRYRRWTGTGHRVHSSLTADEADHDLFVLLGRRSEDFSPGQSVLVPRNVHTVRRDPAGTDGWSGIVELFTAFEVTLAYVYLGDPRWLVTSATSEVDRIEVLVESTSAHWGVEWLVADPDVGAPAARQTGMTFRVTVAGRVLLLALYEVGNDSLDAVWQAAMLRDRVRDPSGVYVLAPRDRFGLLLSEAVKSESRDSSALWSELEKLARALSVPWDPGDPEGSARRRYQEFLVARSYAQREGVDRGPDGTSLQGASGRSRLLRLPRRERRG